MVNGNEENREEKNQETIEGAADNGEAQENKDGENTAEENSGGTQEAGAEEAAGDSAGAEAGASGDASGDASPEGGTDEGPSEAAPQAARSSEHEEDEPEDFGAMFEESLKKREFDDGEIIRGVVVGVLKDQVMVDIGGKSEGYVPMHEFRGGEDEPEVAVGDEIEVVIERRDEEDGIMRLSKDKAGKRRTWDELEESYKKEEAVKGKIVEKVKGGLMVDLGIKAFLPGSQADIRPIRNLEKLLGVEDEFLIIKFNRRRGNVVVSRRVMLEREREDMRSETLDNLEKDQVVKGVVKNITDYGAFIDLGGIDGLLHITDMSYGRINHPGEIDGIKVGEEVTVKVLRFNKESEKVSLGLKQILPDPWENVEKKYPVGTIVIGNVVSVTDYGAFVELEKGVEGLVHVSELSWSKKRVHPSKVVKPGQEVEAKVLDIDMTNRRISLSVKQAQQNPWDMLEIKYPVGARISGKIRNITNFGVFVGVEDGIDGLVHISDLSWTKRVKHPSEMFKKGQEVDCQVLKIDKENERFSLGIKQAMPDPWESVPSKYRPGEDVQGKVVNITDFGVFVELEEGIEGLIHISELSHDKVKDPTEMVQEGQEITAEILNVDITERKIRLSVKARERSEDQQTYRTYQKQEGDGTSKLGELIQDKLSKFRMSDEESAEEAKPEETPAEETPAEGPMAEASASETPAEEEKPDDSEAAPSDTPAEETETAPETEEPAEAESAASDASEDGEPGDATEGEAKASEAKAGEEAGAEEEKTEGGE